MASENSWKRINDACSELCNADACKPTKIKTHFARIFVGGSADKPCFNILYFDPTDGDYHIGFSSFCLDYVFKWLAEEFEIVEKPMEFAVVVHGHNTYDHNSAFGCSVCGFEDWDTYTADIQKYNYCPNCGAKMDGDGNG